jgi:hypothetical protein
MNQRIAKKKLRQFYDDRKELLEYIRETYSFCYGEYPNINANEEDKSQNKTVDKWLYDIALICDNYFRLERARLINAIRRW